MADIREVATQLISKANGDPEGERHFLLASVYELLLKREAKQVATRFKNLLYLHRHVDLAERRMKEKEEAFIALCNVCRQDMLALQDSNSARILEWQQSSLINKIRENNGLAELVQGLVLPGFTEQLQSMAQVEGNQSVPPCHV